MLERLGALVVVNLLVLLTVGAAANDTFGFFADWTDLAGAFQSAPHASTSSPVHTSRSTSRRAS